MFNQDFSNFIESIHIKKLAEADEFGCVRAVQEFYADYLAVNRHIYSLNMPLAYHVK